MSRDVRSGWSSRPRHRRVLYFPHRRLWIMECSCKDGAIEVAWDEFVRLFRAKFVPEHIQDRMEQEFLSLTQGSMIVLEYKARFAELSKYAPHIVADERMKAKKFVMGLKPSLRTRLVAFDHRTLDKALSAACRQEGEMEQYLEEKKALQKRPAATFQRQDKKKAVYQAPQRPITTSSAQVPSQRSPSVKKECPHCGMTHGGFECWMNAGKCLKCGSSDHKIKDCPRLQQGVQRGAPAPAVASPGNLHRLEDSWDIGERFPDVGLASTSTKNPEQELDVKPSCRQDLQSAASDLVVNLLERPDTAVKFFSAEQ
ncbi:hypothetical protein Taro_016255 [Colocasia esculenta]|uniref:CCHC-type domain-containing protein n=1 Tax=Colocasia esculenta TaxID=4460 RepID=A0A843UPQ0_COLES|nr:hypothetical protein [Colocasia esculenta]